MRAIPMLLATSMLAACAGPSGDHMRQLQGEVFYLQRMALPADAVLSVSLQDISLADAPSLDLARQQGKISGQVPLSFRLDYDPALVEPGHSYAVSALIELEGRLLFISTERHSVKLDGSDPQPLRIKLEPVR